MFSIATYNFFKPKSNFPPYLKKHLYQKGLKVQNSVLFIKNCYRIE